VIGQSNLFPFITAIATVTDAVVHAARCQPSRTVSLLEITVEPKNRRAQSSSTIKHCKNGSAAKWLACWTQMQKAWVQIATATLSGNNLRQTAHTHRASVHEAAKLVAALLRVVGVTAGLPESNGSLPLALYISLFRQKGCTCIIHTKTNHQTTVKK